MRVFTVSEAAYRGAEIYRFSFLTSPLEERGCKPHAPAALTPPNSTYICTTRDAYFVVQLMDIVAVWVIDIVCSLSKPDCL